MKKIKFIANAFVVASLVVTLSSSVPIEKEGSNENITLSKNEFAVENVDKSDKGVSYSEMKKVAEQFKSEKLSFKEKIALKLFGKKFSENSAKSSGGKSQLIALLLAIFVGGIGAHRFYLGYTWQGVVQLLTAGGCGIWALIDIIRIITGDLTPKDGAYDKTL